METKTENVVCVYDNGFLRAIIHRDNATGHKLVYLADQASVDEIAKLINPEHGAI